MATQPLSREVLQEAVNAIAEHGNVTKAAKALGIPRNTLYSRKLNAEIAGIEPRLVSANDSGAIVMHVPDLHAPFMHPDAAAFIQAAQAKFKPTVTVLAGDELDQHALSDYTSDPNGYSAGQELDAGLKQLESIYAIIKEALVCESNHGQRPFKRAYKAGLPAQYMKTYAEFMDAPQGWVWADEFIIDNVRYTHGEEANGTNGALNLAIRMGMSQAVGHWHGNAGAAYFFNGRTMVFGLYSGCLIDPAAYAFRYGKHAKLKPILGLSIVDNGVPSFIPMQLDAKGRWSGRI